MTNAITYTHAPVGAVTLLRIGNAILVAKDALVTWYEIHRTRQSLRNLSEKQLRDIGLSRFDLL